MPRYSPMQGYQANSPFQGRGTGLAHSGGGSMDYGKGQGPGKEGGFDFGGLDPSQLTGSLFRSPDGGSGKEGGPQGTPNGAPMGGGSGKEGGPPSAPNGAPMGGGPSNPMEPSNPMDPLAEAKRKAREVFEATLPKPPEAAPEMLPDRFAQYFQGLKEQREWYRGKHRPTERNEFFDALARARQATERQNMQTEIDHRYSPYNFFDHNPNIAGSGGGMHRYDQYSPAVQRRIQQNIENGMDPNDPRVTNSYMTPNGWRGPQ